MAFADLLKREDVVTAEKLAEYCQQQTGIPYPTKAAMGKFKKSCNEFFLQYPNTDYRTLCGVVDWAKNNRKRYSDVSRLIMYGMRFAFADGYLTELDPSNREDHIDNLIIEALQLETDPDWRENIMAARSGRARMDVYNQWLKLRKPVLTASTPA